MESYKNQFISINSQNSYVESRSSSASQLSSSMKPILKKKMCDTDKSQIQNQCPIVQRTDSKGCLIEKNGKHKVYFQSPLHIRHDVESWKEYNVDVSDEGNCTCKIF